MKKLLCVLAALGLLMGAQTQARAAEEKSKGQEKINFSEQVWPILKENCFQCHGADKQKGSLRLDRVTEIATLVEEGHVIKPHKPEESELFELISLPAGHDDRMPAEGDPLSEKQIEIIEQWISEGAGVGDVLFERDILPILKQNCIQCHGPDKQKGELRLDSKKAIMEGGDVGMTVMPGNGFDSGLFFRISLPPGDADIMPPESAGDPLPSEKQKLVQKWIDEGAFFGGWEKVEAGSDKEPLPEVAEADAQALSRLREAGALAMPLAQDTNLISVDFRSVAENIGDSHIELLEPVKEQLAWLNLANTRVSDRGVRTLTDFPHLRRLHLENTAVGDNALDALAQIESLRYLNLYGTNVSDDGIQQLMGLEHSIHRVRTAASSNERQVRRSARRVDQLQDKLSDTRAKLTKLRENDAKKKAIEQAKKEADQLADDLKRARADRMAAQVNLRLAEQELERVQGELDQVRELEKIEQDLIQQVDSRQSSVDGAQKRLVNAESSVSEAEKKLGELKKQVENKAKAVNKAKQAAQKAEKAHNQAEQAVKDQQKKVSGAMSQAKQTAQAAVKQLDGNAPGKAAELAGKLRSEAKSAQQAKGKLAELQKAAAEKKKQLDAAQKKVAQARDAHKKAKQAVGNQENKIKQLKGKVQQAKAEKSNAQQALKETEAELTDIENRVTDRRSGYVSNLPNLEKLYLWQTNVTADAADTLKRSRPQLSVSIGQGAPAKKQDKSNQNAKKDGSEKTASAKKIVNDTCPVSGEGVNAAQFVVFKGKKIGFCCGNCKGKFQDNPKKFAGKIAALNN